jgi:hypothetical protein
MLGSNGLGFSPDLNNLEFWQGTNLYDDNETDNKVSGGVNADITESNCLYFNGVDNYTDTGLFASDSTLVVIKGKINASSKQQILLSDDGSNNRKFFFGVVSTNFWRVGYGDTSLTLGSASDINAHTFIFKSGKLWVKDIETDTSLSNLNNIIANDTPDVTSPGTWGGGSSSISMMLGALKLETNNPSNYANFNQYEVKIWIDGVNLSLYLTNSEGSGSTTYDKSGNENHSIVSGTLTNIWATSNDQRPYNLENGFSDALIPQAISTGIYQASTVAYGTWEFLNVYQEAKGDRIELGFIDSDTDITNVGGYRLRLHTTNQIDLIVSGVSFIFSTAADYFQPETYYDIKITRNSTLDEYYPGAIGTFAVYIKGGSFGSTYVLVGSGTDNSVTTSVYLNIEFNSATVGAHLYGININDSRIDMTNFTNLVGTHATPMLPASSVNTTKDVFGNLLTNPSGSKLWNFSENKFAIFRSGDVMTNGDFATDSDWTKSGESEINGGTGRIYSSAGAFSALTQVAIVLGVKYKLSLDIVSNTSGSIKIGTSATGGSDITGSLSNVGNHVFYFTAQGSVISISRAIAVTDIRIDNVTVEEILHEDCQGILDHADFGTKLFTTTISANGTNVALKNTLDYSVAP